MTLKERIDRGAAGEYQGLDNGFHNLNKYIFGIQKKCYMLIGGASGTYKTTLTDFMLFNALKDAEEKGINLEVFYYSFEIDRIGKQCNWLSNHIFTKHNYVIAPEKIKGLGSNRLTEKERELVYSEIDYVEKLFDKIKFTFIPAHPTKIFVELKTYALDNGKMEGDIYVPNDEKTMKLAIMDHIYLLHKEQGFETKQVLDKWSEYCVYLRNIYGYSFINLQQFNDGLSAVDRQKFKGVDLSPQQSDYKDTRNTYQDADVVLGTMNPYKLDMDSCLGYDITRFKDRFLMLKIVKNRLSRDNIAIATYANPQSGTFQELPPAREFLKNEELYKNYV